MYRIGTNKFFLFLRGFSSGACNFKKMSDPFVCEEKKNPIIGSWYSNQPARSHGCNAKIGFKRFATSPEILAKMCKILLVWFGRPILDNILVIRWDFVHNFQNLFLN